MFGKCPSRSFFSPRPVAQCGAWPTNTSRDIAWHRAKASALSKRSFLKFRGAQDGWLLREERLARDRCKAKDHIHPEIRSVIGVRRKCGRTTKGVYTVRTSANVG